MPTIPLTSIELPETTCPKSRGYSFNPALNKLNCLVCGSRHCAYCQKFWSNKWRSILHFNDQYKQANKALTLTFAQWVEPSKVARALEYFWRNIRQYTVREKDSNGQWVEKRETTDKLRLGGFHYTRKVKPYKDLKPCYFGVVEANQRKSQIHIHFLLVDFDFIPQHIYKICWIKAQKSAGINQAGWNVRIEAIKKGHNRYFTKYVTKTVGAKDEIPPQKWGLRGIRYSRNFFIVNSAIISMILKFNRQCQTGNFTKGVALLDFKAGFANQAVAVAKDYRFHVKQLKKGWNYGRDCRSGTRVLYGYLGLNKAELDLAKSSFVRCFSSEGRIEDSQNNPTKKETPTC